MNCTYSHSALVIPINTAIGFAFNRRERALDHIARIRSCSFQIYLSHCIWDWGNVAKSGRALQDVNWLEHTDMVLDQLIGLGDELARFLTLPTSSLTRHRMLRSGRLEAVPLVKVCGLHISLWQSMVSLYDSHHILLPV